MAKRTRVRTHTLGAGWEERFLAAVRKAREQKLVAPEAAEKLRAFAGAYFCTKCGKEHRTESALGRRHARLLPRREPAPGEAKQAAPVEGARGKPKGVNEPAAKPGARRTPEGRRAGKHRAKKGR